MLHEAWDATARRDLVNATGQEPRANEVAEWVAGMQELLADVQIGHQYVCLDGTIIPADAARVEFDGWHSRHRLEFLPHVAALSDDSVERDILANMDYWESNRLQRK